MPDLMRYREQSAAMLTRGMQFLQASSGHGVNPGQMVMVVNQFFPRNAVTVLDGGNTTLWGIAFNPILEPDSFLYSVKMGYLGTGLPFAIGAKLAAPEGRYIASRATARWVSASWRWRRPYAPMPR